MEITQELLPAGCLRILERLRAAGFEGAVVGGCVRDLLRGAVPHDWDVCTSARPEQVLELFRDGPAIPTGLRHGTVTVFQDGVGYEVTTYRVDGVYSDGRRPDQVRFTGILTQDLARRDFTINAMAYVPGSGLKDPFGGREDLARGLIRCVGRADQRFAEDGLRIMRALRFASVLGFRLEDGCAAAIHENRARLDKIARERVGVELLRMLCGAGVENILLEYADVVMQVLPDLAPMAGFDQRNPHHCFDVWTHTVKTVAAVEAEPVLRLAMLLHDAGKPACFSIKEGVGHFYGHAHAGTELAKRAVKTLRLNGDTARCAVELVRYHDAVLEPDPRAVRRWLNKLGEIQFRRLIQVHRADAQGQASWLRPGRMEQFAQVEAVLEKVLREESRISRSDLAVTGRDLLDAGIPQGPAIGRLLEYLLRRVMDEELPNRKEALMQAVKDAQREVYSESSRKTR